MDSLKQIEELKSVKIIIGDSALKNETQLAKIHSSLFDVLSYIKHGKVADIDLSTIDKAHRPVLSQSSMYGRPKQLLSHYMTWSGFQPIDLDFKCADMMPALKMRLHQKLTKFPWYVATAISTSGSGLHIYTASKVDKPVIDSFAMPSQEVMQKVKDAYLQLFEQKIVVIWKCLMMCSAEFETLYNETNDVKYSAYAIQANPITNTLSRRQLKQGEESESNVIDASTGKISQLLYMTYDPEICVNENFTLVDMPLIDISTLYKDTVNQMYDKFSLSILKDKFDKIMSRFQYGIKHDDVTYGDTQFTVRGDIEIVQEGSMSTITPQNYDNTMRYRLAYTLAWLYDLQSTSSMQYAKIEQLYLQMCSGNPKFSREHMAWSKTLASAVERNIHGTAPCVWSAIKELKDKHGWKFKFANKAQYNVQELIKEHNSENQIKDFIMSNVAQNEAFDLKYTHQIDLVENEYLSTYKTQLEQIFQWGLNFLIARPGSGKTEFIKQLTKDGRRVLLVEPYTSILQSKIEPSGLDFYCVYGNRQMDLNAHLNIACTFDKFTHVDPEEVSILYDYIVVDESHLLTMSSYRDVVPANVIDKLQLLNTKVICMTGTPVSEHMFLNFKTITYVNKPLDHNKNVTFVCCQNNGDKLSKIAKQIAYRINEGGKVLFPTNRGSLYTQTIIGAVSCALGRKPNVRYYKKENQWHEFVTQINEQGTLSNIELLFCTNYLSVGIDINDKCQFDVIYDEDFTAQEIEQFNSRLRKIEIASYIYFSMVDSEGNLKNITAYDEIDLTLTKLDQLAFWDMMQLQIKQNSMTQLYDFFAYVFSAPWFYKDEITGEVQVNLTVYKLSMFESKWRQWGKQFNVIQNILTSYGYECKVLSEPLIDEMFAKLVLQAAAQARMEYIANKNSSISRMFASFMNADTFKQILSLQDNQVIDSDKWGLRLTSKNGIVYCVENKQLFLQWRHMLRRLSKFYTFKTLQTVIDYYVIDQKGNYRKNKCMELVNALSIFGATSNNRLADSNVRVLQYFLNDVFENADVVKDIDKQTLDVVIENGTNILFESLGHTAYSPDVLATAQANVRKMWNAVTYHDAHSTLYTVRTLPMFDTAHEKYQSTLKDMLTQLFNASIFEDKTEKLLSAQKLKHSVTKLVFTNEVEQHLPITNGNIIRLKNIEADNVELNDIEELKESDIALEHDKQVLMPTKHVVKKLSIPPMQQINTMQSSELHHELESLANDLYNGDID